MNELLSSHTQVGLYVILTLTLIYPLICISMTNVIDTRWMQTATSDTRYYN